MKFVLLALGGFLVGAVGAGGSVYLVSRQAPGPETAQAAIQSPITDTIVIGTGSITGVYFPAGGAVCRLVNQTRAEHGLRCSVESTDGSAANLAGVASGLMAMGVVQSDWQYHAVQGSAPNANGDKFEALRSVFSLYAEPLTVVTRAESGVATFSDLRGQRFDPGVQGSSQRATMEALFAALGWESDDYVEVAPVPRGEEVVALCTGAVDAIVTAGGHPNGLVTQLTNGCEAKLVPIEGAAVDELVAQRRRRMPGQDHRHGEGGPGMDRGQPVVQRLRAGPERIRQLENAEHHVLQPETVLQRRGRGQQPAGDRLHHDQDIERQMRAARQRHLHRAHMQGQSRRLVRSEEHTSELQSH